MNLEQLRKQFEELYGKSSGKASVYFSPGRVNLIGEHTDYNGGYVFPCALSYGTYLFIRKTNDNAVKFASANFSFTADIHVKDISQKQNGHWINYPMGVMNEFSKLGTRLTGMELLFSGNVPNGAGLSSSASIEIVTATAINDLYKTGLSGIDLAKLGQRAENMFVGVNCGIMDQFASVMGKKDSAIFLNCDTLEYELVPVVMDGYKLVISNTNKRRGLADSKYNERRGECEKAVEYISSRKRIKNLGELMYDEFEVLKDTISEENVLKRARHVITEIQRTKDAVRELKSGNLKKFGELMNGSHDSLRDDYEVTGIELDTLVEEARKIDGVIGSRMTGAGFGGCTVSMVHDNAIEQFIDKVGRNYQARTGLKADFYIADIGDGARKLGNF
ncbi:MAG TPA: galactokinase [Bacteroidales bacterium]|nr:galactokinase [Bacteroidales bacterium]